MEKEPTNKDVLQAIQSLSSELRTEFKNELRNGLSETKAFFSQEMAETKKILRQEIGETKELAKNSYTLAEKSYQLNVDTLQAVNIFAQHTEDRFQALESTMSDIKFELKHDISEVKDDVSTIKMRQDNVPYRFELNELDRRVTSLERERTN